MTSPIIMAFYSGEEHSPFPIRHYPFPIPCIHTPPHYIDITNKMITDFVWNNKKPKIKRDTLIGPKERGGLDLPEFETIAKSLQTAWVQKMKKGVGYQWM